MQRLKDQYNELKQEISVYGIDKKDDNKTPRKLEAEIVRINESISITPRSTSKPDEESKVHSRRQSSESNDCTQSVKVVIRVRPPLKEEVWDKSMFSIVSNSLHIKENKLKSDVKIFEFENIVTPDQNEDAMFEQIKDAVTRVSNGNNACIMAYGQTGSGKTYTMNTIITKSIQKLKHIEKAEVSVQCIEVYNEQTKNLLTENPKSTNPNEPTEIKLGADWSAEALKIITNAISRRTTKFTECNERSSRSHAIFTLNISTSSFTSKIQFVDLAGSERVGKSNVSGETLKEALLINKSLSALQDVISALENKQKHIPYRNSMLTKILQPTLGGSSSLVTMIVACSPSLDSISETVCTLALASRVKTVDLGFFIRKNLKNKEVERTLSLLEKERAEKTNLGRIIDKLKRDVEYYDIAVKDRDNRIAVLNKKIKEKAYNESKIKTKPEPIKNEFSSKSVKVQDKNIQITKNFLHQTAKEIARVVSLSPTAKFLSPTINNKPTRIPTPNFINLKLSRRV